MAKGKKTGGRQPGSVNKLTVEAKEAIELAFEGIGGVPQLIEWAKANRTVFYGRVWSKLIPRDLNVSGEVLHRLESIITAGIEAEERKSMQ